MKWRTVAIVGLVLFVAGFLSGFIPQHQKASDLAKQLDTVRLESKLREIRGLASLSYIDATKLNYGSAAEDSERMFSLAREVANDTKDDGLRSSLNGLATFRETVMDKLRAADAKRAGAAPTDCAKDTKGIEALMGGQVVRELVRTFPKGL
ncbi:MAG TPA: hypothetical protein VMT53_03515 [Terriglobales bacterium]|nr:hypothetical protein [Terriglobales bacterium]